MTLTTETVIYREGDTELEGYLAVDDGLQGARPAVLVIHEWGGPGEFVQAQARRFAELGYLGFAVDVYGRGRRFTEPAECSAEANRFYADWGLLRRRVRAAFELVARDPRVDASRIAAVGYCFGGTAAIELARDGAPLAGAVSVHGRLFRHEPPEVDAIACPLLIVTGAEDRVVPDEAIAAFADELRTRPELDWQLALHAGAGHGFAVPSNRNFDERTERRSWAQLRAFLDETVGAAR